MFVSSPARGQRLTASPAWPAVSIAPCIEGRRVSTVISLCRSLWRPRAAAAADCRARGSRLICQQVSQSPSGGAPDRSAPVQVCGLAPLARLTVFLSMGAPLQRSAASALPEGSHRASCRGTTSFEIFCYRARESQGLCGPRPLKFKSTRGKTNAGLIILRVACVAFERRDALNERDEARAAQLRRSSDSIAIPSQQY